METTQSPAEIYDHVFDAVMMSIDGDWIEIHLQADVDDQSVGLKGDYRTAEGETLDLDVRKLDYSVSRAIRDLSRIMADTEKSGWTKAVFLLKRSGEYAVHFE
ncbi:hypothetical protein QO002_002033 [Pararhizobium capsulatum DSM 1112]|uniref:Uncharacterized protein n=1 Tax=Pararhizobium capsulatum DSM 1112 TaxID=1121113 RepID=A0ABU0BQX6_9HYPH|nr:hypothetical protein [Pararhizobium capsulatum]MDQ0319895.1 hypothetical protein [Pararhizobium capsulatum DSM 1112]